MILMYPLTKLGKFNLTFIEYPLFARWLLCHEEPSLNKNGSAIIGLIVYILKNIQFHIQY